MSSAIASEPSGCIDVPRCNLVTLAAAAVAHTRYPWLVFRDPLAEQVWRTLGADASPLADPELRAALGRTLLLDKVARGWAARGGGAIVEVGAGFSTRHGRLRELPVAFAAVDEAPIAEARRELFPPPRAFEQLAAPLEGRTWLRDVVRCRTLVVVEDAFLDVADEDVIAILEALSAELPVGSRIAASYGRRTPFAVANPDAQRRTLEVTVGRRHAVRFPRLTWVDAPMAADRAYGTSVALLEAS